ncbi:MAG: 7-carboxy-7-deazaguanine synthase QueE [Aphanocapsa feldmannii 277cV]|uniref:7-carboxy-7-deazaguanine synthase n=2 Tax=Aphanocapsa feldmannii TaxID=192050 RepID=A0A524RMX9_9CHRO|nr:MAG: 7-carboxy-7-deazaguanine synthase QueE [Aphanocapsa feldmannii 288cV]TGG92153.1 MAG: 7-carboxy-7-deazaguanine synthase QueE [Aphanocapsa feldmannii 277cV]TGH23698.1 MAG: 7-carboxy-7-deazaguanine synthase QueE [Aphanocapsa feldmannii 277cI]
MAGSAVTSPSLPVLETFHSIQGEGTQTGFSAFFIRLGGCTVACPWCDTKHSWPMAGHPRRTLEELAAEARAHRPAFVLITGGEPLHHDLTELCAVLQQAGLAIHLETSGVDPLSGQFDWITLSPKAHRPPRPELLTACHALKVVVHSEDDLAFAVAMAARVAETTALLLQPGAGSETGQRLAIAFIKQHPRWRLSLQTHKWLGLR